MKPQKVREWKRKGFGKACEGSEMLSLPKTGEAVKPLRQRRSFRRLTIQLSLGRVLLSRAGLCFTGQAQDKEPVPATQDYGSAVNGFGRGEPVCGLVGDFQVAQNKNLCINSKML
jgi:hypothetical protein